MAKPVWVRVLADVTEAASATTDAIAIAAPEHRLKSEPFREPEVLFFNGA